MDQSNGAAAAAAAAAVAAAARGRQAPDHNEGCEGKKDEDGMTPFLQAARSGTPQTLVHLVDTLGDHTLADRTNNGMTCLHLAAERRDTDHRKDGSTSSPSSSSAAVIRLLLDSYKGRPELPDVDARDEQSFTPLHVVRTSYSLPIMGRRVRRKNPVLLFCC